MKEGHLDSIGPVIQNNTSINYRKGNQKLHDRKRVMVEFYDTVFTTIWEFFTVINDTKWADDTLNLSLSLTGLAEIFIIYSIIDKPPPYKKGLWCEKKQLLITWWLFYQINISTLC